MCSEAVKGGLSHFRLKLSVKNGCFERGPALIAQVSLIMMNMCSILGAIALRDVLAPQSTIYTLRFCLFHEVSLTDYARRFLASDLSVPDVVLQYRLNASISSSRVQSLLLIWQCQ